MPTIHLTCGKICSGKSYFAKNKQDLENVIILSVDDVMNIIRTAHGGCLGHKHKETERKTLEYLLIRAVDIINMGVDVIIDHGFWYKSERDYAQEYLENLNIAYNWHYFNEDFEIRKTRLIKRNKERALSDNHEYIITPKMMEQFDLVFEEQ